MCGLDSEPNRQVRLADTRRTQQDNVLSLGTKMPVAK